MPNPAGFDVWMDRVNAALELKCGMDSRDLPDWPYRDAYDDGKSASRAAASALKAAKDDN